MLTYGGSVDSANQPRFALFVNMLIKFHDFYQQHLLITGYSKKQGWWKHYAVLQRRWFNCVWTAKCRQCRYSGSYYTSPRGLYLNHLASDSVLICCNTATSHPCNLIIFLSLQACSQVTWTEGLLPLLCRDLVLALRILKTHVALTSVCT